MAVIVPVMISLVEYNSDEHCTEVLCLRTDSMAPLSDFKEQLAVALSQRAKTVMKLTYRGSSVYDEAKLYNFAECNAAPRFAVSYFPTGSVGSPVGYLRLYVHMLTGMKLALICRPSTSFEGVKQLLGSMEGMPSDQQRLIFAGKQLEDSRSLRYYNIKHESSIHLVLRMRGGGCTTFADVSNSEALEEVGFDENAPRLRVCDRGLNVEGVCGNHECAAHRQMVVDMKGMVSWSLLAGKANCPECKTQFQPITCAFVGCVWMYDGRKEGPCGPIDLSGNWQEASDGVYHRFQEDGNTANWHSLVLSAKPLGCLECPICFEAVIKTKASRTGCNHVFHTPCLDTWMRTVPSAGCPMCRKPL